jgi:hypothetical protein
MKPFEVNRWGVDWQGVLEEKMVIRSKTKI